MRVRSNKIEDIIRYCKAELSGIYSREEANSFINILFSHFCGFLKADISLRKYEYINESDLINIYSAIPDLKAFKPIQYITGETEFYGLKINVNENVLIPRPETEELVEVIINDSKGRGELQILDIGTGSGCIAIALAKMITKARVSALDISEKALKLATMNAENNRVDINFLTYDILTTAGPDPRKPDKLYKLDKLDKLISIQDIIVSNPPYVPESEKSSLSPNVTNFEPHIALFVEDDNPLKFYERIIELAINHSKNGILIYFEIHENFKVKLENLLNKMKILEYDFYKDINEKFRILKLRI